MYAFFSSLSPLSSCMFVCISSSCCWCWHVSREMEQAGLSDLEIISQPVEDENQYLAPPVQLVSFGYRDLPLAALDLSLAGSQLLSNADDDENRDGWVQLWCIVRIVQSDTYIWFVCFNKIWQLWVTDVILCWFQTAFSRWRWFSSGSCLATERCEWHTGGLFFRL